MIESTNQTSEKCPTGKFLTLFQHKLLQKSLQENLANHHRQRLLIMKLADEGKTQSEICKTLNCCSTTARHWILMAKMGMAHQWQEQPIGRPHTTNHQYRERLKELFNNSPQEHGYAFKKWTGYWLSRHLAKELNIEINERQINRILNQMGLSTRSKSKLDQEINPSVTTTNMHIIIQDLSSDQSLDDKSMSIMPIINLSGRATRSAL
jgi:transposase